MRGTGLGKELMVEALQRTEQLVPDQPIKIAAQRMREKFYTCYGFKTIAEPYEEDWIIHVDMKREAGGGRREAGARR